MRKHDVYAEFSLPAELSDDTHRHFVCAQCIEAGSGAANARLAKQADELEAEAIELRNLASNIRWELPTIRQWEAAEQERGAEIEEAEREN